MKKLKLYQPKNIKTFYFKGEKNNIPNAKPDHQKEALASNKANSGKGSAYLRQRLASKIDSIKNGRKQIELLPGKKYAEKKGIVIENPITITQFNTAWKSRQTSQRKKNFQGMIIPPKLKNKVWDYVQNTFKGKDEKLSDNALKKAIKTAIEKEAVFLKKVQLDKIQRNADGSPRNKFPDGSLTEGDYIDTLAAGDSEKTDDNISPELLAYLRATNALGLGKDADNGNLDMNALSKKYKNTIKQLKELNIQNLSDFRANVGKLGKNPTPAQAMQLLNDGKIDKNKVSQYREKQGSNLWDLIKAILEYITGNKYAFSNNADRYGGKNINLESGKAVASNTYLNELLKDPKLSSKRKAILSAAAGDLGKNEGNRQLMSACSRAGGISAGPQPWCMAWVQKILGQVGNSATKKSAWARDGLTMGTSSTSNPQPGDLVIVARGNGGHIGFFLGTDRSGKPIIIGGNQGDKVSVKVERSSLLGIVSVV